MIMYIFTKTYTVNLKLYRTNFTPTTMEHWASRVRLLYLRLLFVKSVYMPLLSLQIYIRMVFRLATPCQACLQVHHQDQKRGIWQPMTQAMKQRGLLQKKVRCQLYCILCCKYKYILIYNSKYILLNNLVLLLLNSIMRCQSLQTLSFVVIKHGCFIIFN